MGKADCPLARRCLYCGEKGHIARDCPKKVAAKGAGKGRSVAPAGAKQSKKEDDEVSVRSNSTAATRADLEKALLVPVPVPVPQKCGFCGTARITPKHKKGVNACKHGCQSCFRLFK